MKRLNLRTTIGLLLSIVMGASVLYSVTKYTEWKKRYVTDAVTVSTPMTRVSEDVKNSVYGIYNITEKGRYGGSGFVYKIDETKAYLLTNEHVVSGSKELKVFFEVGAMVPAKIEGVDKNFDLAVVSISKSDLPKGAKALSFSETELALGEDILAMGTPLNMEFYNTTTVGVVSGLSRVFVETTAEQKRVYYNDFIQVDAAINHGNSGGPLFNKKGEVVGLNARGISGDTESPVANLAFSIPNYVIRSVLPYIEKGEAKPILYFGLVLDGYYEQSHEVVIEKDNTGGNTVAFVQVGSPAEQAGFKVGDIITGIDGKNNVKTNDIAKKLMQSKSGTTVNFVVKRSGSDVALSVLLNKEVK